MFEIGTGYRFVMIEGTSDGWGEVSFTETVIATDGPLLKLESGRIINSHSSLFVTALPVTAVAATPESEAAPSETT